MFFGDFPASQITGGHTKYACQQYLVGGFKHFLFSIICGMSSFPLTNSYFSRWLLHHQPDTVRGSGDQRLCFFAFLHPRHPPRIPKWLILIPVKLARLKKDYIGGPIPRSPDMILLVTNPTISHCILIKSQFFKYFQVIPCYPPFFDRFWVSQM